MKEKSLGQFLRQKRIDGKFTQLQAARELGHTSAQYISNFERGLCEPSVETAVKLCKLYGITKKELYEVMIDVYRVQVKARIFSNASNN